MYGEGSGVMVEEEADNVPVEPVSVRVEPWTPDPVPAQVVQQQRLTKHHLTRPDNIKKF